MSLPASITAASEYDAGTDDPKQARAQLKSLRDELAQVLAHLQAFSLTAPSTPVAIGQGLEVSGGNLVSKLDGASLAKSAAGLKVADDGVGLAQLEAATAGDLLYWEGAGDPARLAKGSDGEILKLASGLPSWAPDDSGWSLVSAATWASGATLSVALHPAAGFTQELELVGLYASSNANLDIDFSDDGEATYETGIVERTLYHINSAGTITGNATTGADNIPVTASNDVHAAAASALFGRVTLRRSQDTGYTFVEWDVEFRDTSSTPRGVHGRGRLVLASAITHVRFSWSAGAAAGGELYLRKIAAPDS